MAHYCEHGIRESYAYERAKANADKKGDKFDPHKPQPMAPPDWSQFRQGRGKD